MVQEKNENYERETLDYFLSLSSNENISSFLKNLDKLEGFLDVIEGEIKERFLTEQINLEVSYEMFQNLKVHDFKTYRILTKAMNPKFSLFGSIDDRLFRAYSDIHTLKQYYQKQQQVA